MEQNTEKIFSQRRFRGLIYSAIAMLGIGYEILFSKPIRLFPIAIYSLIIVAGVLYFHYIKE